MLSVNPTQGPEKVEHLQQLFYNVHDLINRYRPHQARESLILTMEEQVDKIKADVSRVSEAKLKMGTLLKGMETLKDVSTAHADGANGDANKTDFHDTADTKSQLSGNDVWDALERELGS